MRHNDTVLNEWQTLSFSYSNDKMKLLQFICHSFDDLFPTCNSFPIDMNKNDQWFTELGAFYTHPQNSNLTEKGEEEKIQNLNRCPSCDHRICSLFLHWSIVLFSRTCSRSDLYFISFLLFFPFFTSSLRSWSIIRLIHVWPVHFELMQISQNVYIIEVISMN